MQRKISAHFGITVGLPVLMLLVIAAIVSVELQTIGRSQQTVFALSTLQRTARDLVLQGYLHRLSTRGFVLTLDVKNASRIAQSRTAIAADFAALRRGTALVPGIAALVDGAESTWKRIIPRQDMLIVGARRDRQSLLDAYIGKDSTPLATAARLSIAANAADATRFNTMSARVEEAANAAQRNAETVAHQSVTVAATALFITLAAAVMVTLAIAFGFRRTRVALSHSETRYSALTDATAQMIWIHDEHETLEYVNERWSAYTGLTLSSGLKARAVVHRDDLDSAALAKEHGALRPGHYFECEARLRCHDGTYRWHSLRAVPLEQSAEFAPRWIVTATDVQKRKTAELALQHSEAELSYRTHHDPLTNLPNRSKLMDRLARIIAQAKRDGSSVVVLYLDLDHFKSINDTLGHDAADTVLVKTAGRINSTLRGDDSASRLSGDEFVLVCPAASAADATRIAERLQAAVHGPMEVNDKRLVISCSMGISVYPQDGSEALDLVQKANLAVGVAKNSGCGTWCMYRDQIQLPAVSSLELELDLREAIALDQFVVYYQPVINVDSGCPVGAEALVRWAHPVRGMLPPSEFISFAESYDLIAPIGEFVLHAACALLQRLDLRASDDFSIAVNVSARQFTKPGFVGIVASALAARGVEARRLGIEITESVIMGDTAAVIATLAELKALGVKLSLDDFGTGYSSLAYIKNFPIHTLKIDRSFVIDMADSVTDQAIAKTIITLAHSLGMNVVAEGVETAEQLDLLRAYGTDCTQGYLLSRPLSAADLASFLARANLSVVSAAR